MAAAHGLFAVFLCAPLMGGDLWSVRAIIDIRVGSFFAPAHGFDERPQASWHPGHALVRHDKTHERKQPLQAVPELVECPPLCADEITVPKDVVFRGITHS